MTKVIFLKYMGVKGWQAYLQLAGFHSLSAPLDQHGKTNKNKVN